MADTIYYCYDFLDTNRAGDENNGVVEELKLTSPLRIGDIFNIEDSKTKELTYFRVKEIYRRLEPNGFHEHRDLIFPFEVNEDDPDNDDYELEIQHKLSVENINADYILKMFHDED